MSPGGYLIYDSTWPRIAVLAREDITILGVPLAKICNENFDGARTRILMKNIVPTSALLAALLDARPSRSSAQLLAETFAKKPALVDVEHEGDPARLRLREREHFACPLPLRVEPHGQDRGATS